MIFTNFSCLLHFSLVLNNKNSLKNENLHFDSKLITDNADNADNVIIAK